MILNVENTTPERRALWIKYEELASKISLPAYSDEELTNKNVMRRQLEIVEQKLGGDKC